MSLQLWYAYLEESHMAIALKLTLGSSKAHSRENKTAFEPAIVDSLHGRNDAWLRARTQAQVAA